MRGEICVGSASFLSFAALLLLIFVHVGQINTSAVPRGIAMAKVNVSGYGEALGAAFSPDPINDLYTTNASAPLGAQAGLRQFYEFGLYSHCAYVNKTAGICSNTTVASKFLPYDAITSDMVTNYTQATDSFLKGTTFHNSSYLGTESKAAYYLILLGSICTALTLFSGVLKHTVAFLISSTLSVLGSFLLLVGAALWTVIIKKTEAVNSITVSHDGAIVPMGITVSVGPGLYLTWAAFACLAVSIVPYMLSCCTYRG
jgi:hypothetical protein